MEKEKVDKSALGYDYKGQTDKHQSQKGEIRLATIPFCLHLLDFHPTLQTTPKGSEGNTEWKRRRWTRLLWATTTKARQTSTSRRKVGQRCSRSPLNASFPLALVCRSDYSKGFGGKFGVEREKVDKAALGYDYKSQTEKHQSQKGEATLGVCSSDLKPTLTGCVCSDYSSGFGGRYGVQTDRMDKVS